MKLRISCVEKYSLKTALPAGGESAPRSSALIWMRCGWSRRYSSGRPSLNSSIWSGSSRVRPETERSISLSPRGNVSARSFSVTAATVLTTERNTASRSASR